VAGSAKRDLSESELIGSRLSTKRFSARVMLFQSNMTPPVGHGPAPSQKGRLPLTKSIVGEILSSRYTPCSGAIQTSWLGAPGPKASDVIRIGASARLRREGMTSRHPRHWELLILEPRPSDPLSPLLPRQRDSYRHPGKGSSLDQIIYTHPIPIAAGAVVCRNATMARSGPVRVQSASTEHLVRLGRRVAVVAIGDRVATLSVAVVG
jgi:hypothetical protein